MLDLTQNLNKKYRGTTIMESWEAKSTVGILFLSHRFHDSFIHCVVLFYHR